jgi:hypothetical protein
MARSKTVQLKTGTPDFCPLLHGSRKIAGAMQPLVGPELFQSKSHAQAMTTLSPACSNHCAPTTGALTNEEAVSTLAPNDGGLVGTFHV